MNEIRMSAKMGGPSGWDKPSGFLDVGFVLFAGPKDFVYYDITDTKARTRVHDYLEAQGFERIQYSVFVGVIDQHRWQKVWSRLCSLHARHCKEEDKIYSHVIEADHFRKMSILGPALDVAWILQEMHVLFIDDQL